MLYFYSLFIRGLQPPQFSEFCLKSFSQYVATYSQRRKILSRDGVGGKKMKGDLVQWVGREGRVF